MAGLYDLGKRAQTPEKDTEKLRDYAQQLRDVAILGGELCSATVLSGSNTVALQHPLRRAYLGAIFAGSRTGIIATALTPAGTKANGEDPTKTVRVSLDSAASGDIEVLFWVF